MSTTGAWKHGNTSTIKQPPKPTIVPPPSSRNKSSRQSTPTTSGRSTPIPTAQLQDSNSTSLAQAQALKESAAASTTPVSTPKNIWEQRKTAAQAQNKAQSGKPAPLPTNQSAARSGSATLEQAAAAAARIGTFNAAEAMELLGRDATRAVKYEMPVISAASSGGAWSPEPSTMANGTPFFKHLTQQIQALQSRR